MPIHCRAAAVGRHSQSLQQRLACFYQITPSTSYIHTLADLIYDHHHIYSHGLINSKTYDAIIVARLHPVRCDLIQPTDLSPSQT